MWQAQLHYLHDIAMKGHSIGARVVNYFSQVAHWNKRNSAEVQVCLELEELFYYEQSADTECTMNVDVIQQNLD